MKVAKLVQSKIYKTAPLHLCTVLARLCNRQLFTIQACKTISQSCLAHTQGKTCFVAEQSTSPGQLNGVHEAEPPAAPAVYAHPQGLFERVPSNLPSACGCV